jgi:hypothetical protein
MQPLFQSAKHFYEKTDPYFVTNGSVCGSGRPTDINKPVLLCCESVTFCYVSECRSGFPDPEDKGNIRTKTLVKHRGENMGSVAQGVSTKHKRF